MIAHVHLVVVQIDARDRDVKCPPFPERHLKAIQSMRVFKTKCGLLVKSHLDESVFLAQQAYRHARGALIVFPREFGSANFRL